MNSPVPSPTKWKLDASNPLGDLWIVDSGPECECLVAIVTRNVVDGVDYQQANARLIATAPKLLEHLKWIGRVANKSKKWEIRGIAREAIAKATLQA